MTSLTQAVENLVANPRPILCLDTCDFLDVVRCFVESDAEANLYNAQSFRTILQALFTNPDQFQVVVTYLVRHELDQNLGEVRKKVIQHLEEMDRKIDRISEACGLGMLIAPTLTSRLSALPLASGLVDLAESLMDRAFIIDKDDECIRGALDRVMDRRRPSHKGEIKDSIHWEHYLELSRRLVAAGHLEDRFFVSANKLDFWETRNAPNIHPDLKPESVESGLQFHGRLDEALRKLGIRSLG